MSRLQKVLVGTAVVVVLGVIIGFSIFSKAKAKGEEVYMAKAEVQDLASAVSATGKIEAKTKVNVQSSVIGEIVDLPVKEGDVVRKGDLLVQIDPERYRSEVDRLEANLRMQRIAKEQQQVSLENQRRTLKRHRDLFERSGLVSQEMLEQSELQVRTSEINLRSLEEQISQAEAYLAKARDELSKTRIVSPIDGTVTQLNAEKGEITLTGTMNNPGTVIMIVSDMSEILAEVDVDETRVVQVEPGQAARITVDAIGETQPYGGKVTEIAGTATKRTGQEVQVFPVKVVLTGVDPKLRPGMTAKARIETRRADHALTIPLQAVLLKPAKEVDEVFAKREKPSAGEAKAATPPPAPAESAGANEAASDTKKEAKDKVEVVFRVVDGKATMTRVRTGISDETDVVILEGLSKDETVVTGPYRALKNLADGDAVREKEASAAKDEDGKAKEEGEEGSGVQVEVD